MSQGSLDRKVRFLAQKMWSVARVRTYTQTHRHTDTQSDYCGHPFRVSGVFPSTYHQGSAQYAGWQTNSKKTASENNNMHISFSKSGAWPIFLPQFYSSWLEYPCGEVNTMLMTSAIPSLWALLVDSSSLLEEFWLIWESIRNTEMGKHNVSCHVVWWSLACFTLT